MKQPSTSAILSSSGLPPLCAAVDASIKVCFVPVTLFVIVLLAAPAVATERVSPVAVVSASGPAFPQGRANGNPPDADYAAERAIDGDPTTFCCLLDDTLDGSSPTTIPANAAAPVTGRVVFDLGRPVVVTGARLVARTPGGALNPKLADFFCFAHDDPVKGEVRTLQSDHSFRGLHGGQYEDVTWDGVRARYVGMRVRSSYESGGPVHYNFQIGEMEFFVEPMAQGPGSDKGTALVYCKQKTLPETMLAARRCHQACYEGLKPAGGQGQSLWERIRRDFPAAKNRLLAYARFDWFQAPGWFGHVGNTELEQRLLQRALGETGPVAKSLQQQLQQLIETKAPADDVRWLQLCAKGAELALLLRETRSLGAAIDDLEKSFAERYPADKLRRELHEIERRAAEATRPDSDDSSFDRLLSQLERLKRRALVEANPLMPEKLLFVKRYTYSPGWYYAEFMRASRFGGNLCILSLADGNVRELVPELAGGIFDRFDLSFDGRRVLFAYKAKPGKGFRLYEVGIDGDGLRQLTTDPPDEEQRVAKYWHPRYKPSGVYRHHTDDFHPCYLPDGGICFASTRCERGVLCDQSDTLTVNLLYRMDGAGRDLRPLSQGALSESTPSVMPDGRILYTRWEYVDKGVIAVQALWAMYPDGSASREIYGNELEFPPVLIHGRAIPGDNHSFVATATMHHPFAVGPILLLDVSKDIRTHQPIHSLTPDTSLQIDGCRWVSPRRAVHASAQWPVGGGQPGAAVLRALPVG